MSGTIQNNIITVRQGDSFTLNIEIKEQSKVLDLSNATLFMQARDENNQLMFTIAGTAVDAPKGKMALLLTPAQTSMLTGDYAADIQLTLSDGSVHTIWPANVNQIGTLRITPQVTQIGS